MKLSERRKERKDEKNWDKKLLLYYQTLRCLHLSNKALTFHDDLLIVEIHYKNLWGANWKFRHEGNCSASQGLPSDAEQLPEWQNFQFAPKNLYGFFFLHTLPSTSAFRLEYVLFYQFYTKITIFFYQEKFGMAPLLYVDIKTFGQNWSENDVNTSKMMSKSLY